MSEDVGKPPSRKLDPVFSTRDWILCVLNLYTGETITADLAKRFAHELNSVTDGDMLFEPLVFTFLQYEGTTLTSGFAAILAMQIAARRDELDKGPLLLYTQPVRSEWVPLEIQGLTSCVWRNNERGIKLDLLAMGGHPAGHVLTKKVPESWLAFLAYQMGCSRRLTYPHEPWVLTWLWLWGYLVPDADGAMLNFVKWGVPPWMQKRNKEILRRRLRFTITPTPVDPICEYDFDWDCNSCTKGRHECPASTKAVVVSTAT